MWDSSARVSAGWHDQQLCKYASPCFSFQPDDWCLSESVAPGLRDLRTIASDSLSFNHRPPSSCIRNNPVLANLFVIAAMSVKKIICRSMAKCARSGRLNYGTRFYSSSLRAAIWAIAPSAFCRCHLTYREPCYNRAAANGSAMDVHVSISCCVRERRGCNLHAHFVGTPHQKPTKKTTRVKWEEPRRTIRLQYEKLVRNTITKGTMTLHLSILQRQLNWAMWMLIINYQICIGRDTVLRRTRKRDGIIWRKLLLPVILMLDIILQ